MQERKDSEYGDTVKCWKFSSRLEAYVVEQACLRDKSLERRPPAPLKKKRWRGYSEILRSSEGQILTTVQHYVDKLEELGPYRFALEYLSPTPAERALCVKRLEEISPPSLPSC